MRAFVFTDRALDRYAGRFVWLSVNTEAAANAPFLKRYPIPALPTMLVIDPRKDAVTMRFVGGATAPQLAKMLDSLTAKTQATYDLLLSKGDHLASDGKSDEAIAAYEEALAKAPKGWRNFGRGAEALVVSSSIAGKNESCAMRAVDLYPRLRGTPSGANVAATGLSCAAGLDEKHARRVELLTTLEKATKEAFADPKLKVAADDRSGMYLSLIDAREAMKDKEGVEDLTEQWSAFLDDAAAKAKTPSQRTVFDSHRLSAYLNLGAPERAIPMLEQSERDFPNDYNPPARLAAAYKAMKQYDKALAANDRALKLVYGPRKLVVLGGRSDIYEAMGDKANARKAIEESIAFAKSLPEGQRNERRIAFLEKKLTAMQ